MSFKKSDYLSSVLETHRMTHIESLVDKFKIKRTEIKEKLEQNYEDKIYSPFNSGSWKKHTAINSKFDLDIVVPFKRNSFSTITDMFDDLYDFLKEEYRGVAEVRPQKVSVGIRFYTDDDGDIVEIDVVPGRELSKDDYPETSRLNLNINTYDGNYIQTNIEAQIENIKGKSDARQIIRLLKIWKQQKSRDVKSFFMELIVIKAFDNKLITGNLWNKLKTVLEYISDEITRENFTLKDPGNSNNDIADTLGWYQKQSLKNDFDYILSDVDKKDENLKKHFKENENFKEEEDKSGSGGYRVGDTSKAIIPPSNHFG
ncbi:nucleotidyltransferase [uncultured Psychroserpens sp.]|uniref:SMODS domain-containing nucleotidyltransferase n=1 Tax=uncultured Psychroserpens sp. TaxID=255436 RepID=UPI002604E7F8|nr:nucleotidyltransferase [uncultured Psychroserpens sp.]